MYPRSQRNWSRCNCLSTKRTRQFAVASWERIMTSSSDDVSRASPCGCACDSDVPRRNSFWLSTRNPHFPFFSKHVVWQRIRLETGRFTKRNWLWRQIRKKKKNRAEGNQKKVKRTDCVASLEHHQIVGEGKREAIFTSWISKRDAASAGQPADIGTSASGRNTSA